MGSSSRQTDSSSALLSLSSNGNKVAPIVETRQPGWSGQGAQAKHGGARLAAAKADATSNERRRVQLPGLKSSNGVCCDAAETGWLLAGKVQADAGVQGEVSSL
jgi:hypothetical protein